jgi:UDP-glucose 4-epimerase
MDIRRVLLTGASGKIGSAVLPELVKAGYSVRALEYTDGLKAPRLDGVEIVQGDVADPTLAPKLIEGMDGVIHLVNCKENRDRFIDTNLRGTFQLLDACKEAGHIRQYIQAGSDARAGIYHYPQPIPIDETHPHSGYPSYYGLSKVLEEVMCEQYRIMWKLPITVLRFSWVQAEDDFLAHITLAEPNFGVPVWKDWAVTPEQKSFFETGRDAVACLVKPDGTPGKRQVVALADVVKAVMLALANPAAVGEAFNVSAPAPFSYDVVAEYVAGKLDLPVVDFTVAECHDFQIDMTKSRSVLGFQPEHDIFRIVDDAVEFRRSGKMRSVCLYPG